MGAEALRQTLAKTRKSGLSHFFDTHSPQTVCTAWGLCVLGRRKDQPMFLTIRLTASLMFSGEVARFRRMKEPKRSPPNHSP